MAETLEDIIPKKLEFTLDDQPYFMDYQIEWIKDKSRVKFWEKSRRIGATYTESFDTLDWSLETGRDSWFSSADDSAAKEFIEYIAGWCELLEKVTEYISGEVTLKDKMGEVTAYRVRLPNGAKITAMSSNPNRFRSKGGRVIWDEAAHHKDGAAMWKALQATAMWGDVIRVLSTHRGRLSTFNTLIEKIKKGKMKGSVHKTTIFRAIKDGILDRIRKRKTTQAERDEWLEDLRGECLDQDQFDEEYGAIPADGKDSFLSFEMVASVENSNVLWPDNWKDQADGDLYLGFDIARKKHMSVLWILEKIGPMKFTRAYVVMENMKFRYQRETLYKYLSHPKMRRACIDATGIGMQLAEEAADQFGEFKVESVNFSTSTKESLAYGLYTTVEDKTVVIPEDIEIREDLNSVKKVVTNSGNIRFDAQANDIGHADRFWALALADEAAKSYKGQPSVASSGSPQSNNLLKGFDYGGISGW